MNVGFVKIYQTVIHGLLKGYRIIKIMLQLHSKSPTKEIKRNWEIITLGAGITVFLLMFSGVTLLGINIKFFFSEIFNYYGGFIFFIFIMVFCIMLFDYKKALSMRK